MLMGEHAVLDGSRCIVSAINKRVAVTCNPIEDRRIVIDSALGHFETDLDEPELKPPFDFATAAIAHLNEEIPGGVELEIKSEIDSKVGLGSSAAVVAAASAIARRLAGLQCAPKLVMEHALSVIRFIQGRGSGADVAASTIGGVIGYRMDPREIFEFDNCIPLTLVYCGYKRPTPEVIDLVRDHKKKFPEGFIALYELLNATVTEALEAIEKEDWHRLGFLANFNQGLMESMGVNNADLSRIVYALRESPGIYGAKISGSGLGDCVIGIGTTSTKELAGEVIEIAPSKTGLCFE